MHLAEGLLPAVHVAVWSAAAVPGVAAGASRLHGAARVRAGLAAALIFAVTLFPVPVPVVGVTSHLCATPLLALLFGPVNVVLPSALVLLLQALLFAHGGLTTLGANVVTLGVVGPWVAWLSYRGLRGVGIGVVGAAGMACFAGDVAVYAADAGILGWALAGAEPATAWCKRLLIGLAPAQVPLAILEGVASAWLARSLLRRGRWPGEPPRAGSDRAFGVPAAALPLLLLLLVAVGGRPVAPITVGSMTAFSPRRQSAPGGGPP